MKFIYYRFLSNLEDVNVWKYIKSLDILIFQQKLLTTNIIYLRQNYITEKVLMSKRAKLRKRQYVATYIQRRSEGGRMGAPKSHFSPRFLSVRYIFNAISTNYIHFGAPSHTQL